MGSTEELHIPLAIYNIRSQITYQSYFHNLAGYDAHLFIRELAKYTTGMGIIAKNTEGYISFSIKVEVDKNVDKEGNKRTKEMDLRLIDSIKFMSSSLDYLVNNLAR